MSNSRSCPPGRRPGAALRGLVCVPLLCGAASAAAQVNEPAPIKAGRVPPHGVYEPGVNALHYHIVIRLPDSGTYLRGDARIDVRVVAPRPDTVWFDFSGLAVTSASVALGAGAAQTVTARLDDGRVYLPVPRSARTGDTLRVHIAYAGTPDDGLIIRNNVHGVRTAFADNWPDRARFWFPSIDHPSDKATADFEVNAPAGWEVVANGMRPATSPAHFQDQPRDGIWRWSIDVPIPTYTMVIGAADFAVGQVTPCAHGGVTKLRPDGCVPVSYWVYPQDSARADSIFRRAGQMVEYFSQRFGPFAYDKLAHVQSATRFGGMENVGAIFYDEKAIANGRLGEGTVSHETLHQWFGDAVTESDWSHLWLSEGFATYFGMQFFEHANGEAKFRQLVAASGKSYMNSDVTDIAIVDTLATPSNDLFALLNANSYQKGGQVLHMLRGLVGDSAFFTGVRNYYQQHVDGNALTRDLQAALENASGQKLDWFFDEWVYKPGYPIFRVAHTWDAPAGEAVVTVEQVQKAAWPAFRMPIEFAFDTPQGEVRRKLEVSGRKTVLRVKLSSAPTAVRLDPDGWVLKQVQGG